MRRRVSASHDDARRPDRDRRRQNASGTPPSAQHERVEQLQGLVGNQAVVRLLRSGGERRGPADVRPRRVREAGAPELQRALEVAPTVAWDRVTMNGLAGANPADAGNTGPPVNFTAPTYAINVVVTPAGHVASVVKTQAADEGTNFSRYLGAGIYSTGLMDYGGGAIGPYAAGPNNAEIYAELSTGIANDNRDAEQEHVDDFHRAYAITLDIAERAIDAAVAASPLPAQPNNGAAQNAALTFMNNHIANSAGILGTAPFQITANLGNLYTTKFQLSMQRDGNGWHTFRPNMNATSTTIAGLLHWAWYLGAHEVRELQHGGAFSVGVTGSAALIV